MQQPRYAVIVALLIFALGLLIGFWKWGIGTTDTPKEGTYTAPIRNVLETISLPVPRVTGLQSVEKALSIRRSRRDFADTPLSLGNLSQMLWAAQGISDTETGGRTAPSAHSVYPIELYVMASNVSGLAPGIYHYAPDVHKLELLKEGATTEMESFLEVTPQPHPANAPATIFMAGNFLKPQEFFDSTSAIQVTLQESGHIGQNLYLQAEALGLATVVMGGFDAMNAATFIGAEEDETILYLVPVGNRK
ncbi:MAG: nitroreductase [Candidatus Lloydbacteria bacterium CG22_combo_CG10-13_8_21_14_all_47_15]|uniref:Nitroreductase n=2 Tax=Parcubacteria group TaxID=1794811 RepID=A0A2H0CT22_9BACT|nr:MAG: nitroreductase [Candidatus Lloydbacteria bacterium CG22_combo_CG10-13_8_21_14_all_47_15]